MNTEQLTILLTRMAIVDGRDVDQLTLEAWEPLVGDLHYEDAVNGLNAVYRATPRRPTAADIREASKTFQSRREAEAKRDATIERRKTGLCIQHRHYSDEADFCVDHHYGPNSGRCDYCTDRPEQAGLTGAEHRTQGGGIR